MSNLGKSKAETLAVIKQAFREESLSCTRVLEWKSSNSPRPTKARQVKSKVESILIIRMIVHKEFIVAGHSVNFAY
jgi:hypothetical protein